MPSTRKKQPTVTPTEVVSSTRKQPRDQSDAMPKAKRASTLEDVQTWAPPLCATRERLESFNSDVSEELDALDREMAAEEAAAANAITLNRLSASDPSPGKIRDIEVDHVCEDIYEKLEEEAMLDILADLQKEYLATGGNLPLKKSDAPAPTNAPVVATTVKKGALPATVKPTSCAATAPREDLLWDVVATPAMMRAFSATVANSAAPVCAS